MFSLDLFNKHPLDLFPNTSLPLFINNAALDSSGIERVFSYPISLPLSSNNLHQLGFIQRMNGKYQKKHPARLIIEGTVFEIGILEIQGVNDKIQCVFKNQYIDLKEKLDTTPLSKLNIPVTMAMEYCPVYTIKAHTYTYIDLLTDTDHHYKHLVLSINGKLYTGHVDNLNVFIDSINNDIPDLITDISDQVDYVKLEVNTAADKNVEITITPSAPELPQFENYAYFNESFTTSFLSEYTQISAEIDTHLQSTLTQESSHVFAPVYVENAFDGNEQFSGYLNYTGTNLQLRYADIENTPPLSNPPQWSNSVAPFTKVTTVLNAIKEYFNLSEIKGSLLENTSFHQLVLFTTKTLERRIGNYMHFTDKVDTMQAFIPVSSFNLSDFLPDWTCQEFIDAIQSTFFCSIRKQDNILFLDIDNSGKQIPSDMTVYFEPQINKTIKQDKSYSVKYNRYDKKATHIRQLKDIDEQFSPHQKYSIKFFSLFIENRVDDNRIWQVPTFPKQLESSITGNTQDIPGVLLLYHGIQKDSQGNDYPALSNTSTNAQGEETTNFSLELTGKKGLVEQFGKNRIELDTQGDILNGIAHIPFHIIKNMRRTTNFSINLYTPNGQFSAIIKTIAFQATSRGITAAKVTMVKQ